MSLLLSETFVMAITHK